MLSNLKAKPATPEAQKQIRIFVAAIAVVWVAVATAIRLYPALDREVDRCFWDWTKDSFHSS